MIADRAVLVGWTVCPMCGVRVCIHVFVRGVPCELCAPRAARDEHPRDGSSSAAIAATVSIFAASRGRAGGRPIQCIVAPAGGGRGCDRCRQWL